MPFHLSPIDHDHAIHHGVYRIAFPYESRSPLSHGPPPGGIAYQGEDGFGQGGRIFRRHQEPRFSLDHGLRHAADAAADYRHAHGLGLDEGGAQGLAAGGQDEDVQGGEHGRHVAAQAEEADVVGDPQFAGLPLQVLRLRTVAGEDEMHLGCLRQHLRRRFQQVVVALATAQYGDGAHQHSVRRQAKLPAQHRLDAGPIEASEENARRHGGEVVRRDAGSVMLVGVSEPWLGEQMGRAAPWVKWSDRKKDYLPIDPPPLYPRTLLSRGEWRFPVLRGVTTAPTLARDGRIIETPGFDAASGLLLNFAAGAFPAIPEYPTQEEAADAIMRIAYLLRGFPFVPSGTEADPVHSARAVALSAILTALIRLSMRTAPLHAFDAPAAGTGKSLLAEIAGLIASGTRPPAMSQGKSDEEDEKRLSTVLFSGDPVIHIDNCERAISGDFLCSMLTQEVVQARILGLSERRILPANALVLASGNNLQFSGDTSRRAVICRLDAKIEQPDTRVFDADCHEEAIEDRAALVVAGLTALRAYHVAGRPVRLAPMGLFTDWEFVRGTLVWLGYDDPAETRSAILQNDPKKDELLTVLRLWAAAFGPERVEVSAVQAHPGAAALRDKLIEVCCRKKDWSGKSVGWWLRRNQDRIVGGLSFRCLADGAQQHQWWAEGASPAVVPAVRADDWERVYDKGADSM